MKLKPGAPGYRHPYMECESHPYWKLIEKGISDLVKNQDLVEQEDRAYIVGYLCKTLLSDKSKKVAPKKRPAQI